MSFCKCMLIVFILLIFSVHAAETVDKRPFSVGALQYLLERQEYDRFDFYITSYLRQHPDTAALYLALGRRYFEEARTFQSQVVYTTEDCTGGLPRKYHMVFAGPANNRTITVKITGNDSLMHKAFAAIHKAQSLDPEGEEAYTLICDMAMEADLPESLVVYLSHYFDRFGDNKDLLEKALSYARQKHNSIDSPAVIELLAALEQRFSDNDELRAEITAWYCREGLFDRVSTPIQKAVSADNYTIKLLEHAVKRAAITGDFTKACSLSVACYAVSKKALFLNQAVLFALVFDSLRAVDLHNKLVSLPEYVDSQSLTKELFQPPPATAAAQTTRFSGELFHCNFAMAQVHYKRNKDKVAYYSIKAALFFASGMYDSAAYYNLNLLRTLPYDDQRGVPTLFNLAAEYYATGQYTLSFYRFLDLYRFHKGWKDAGVRYGLGLNYEKFGDRENALIHYSYVANNADKKYAPQYNLQDLARKRLRAMKNKPHSTFTVVPQDPFIEMK